MSMRSFGFALAVMVLALVLGSAAGAPNITLVSSQCGTQKIPTGSLYIVNLESVLTQQAPNTATNDYNYTTSSPGILGAPTAYGRGVCNMSISGIDCTLCETYLATQILNICSDAIGALVQLADCSIHYEEDSV